MKRKWIITLIVAEAIGVMLFAILFFYNIYLSEINKDNITRYEWIEMLCEQFGMTEYESTDQYFSDVDEKDIYYSYVQSATEWNIIEKTSRFKGDKYATGEFITLTAMKTMGEKKIQIYLGTRDEISDDTYIELAVAHGLIQKGELKKGFDKAACEKLLEELRSLYYGEFWRDDISDIKYQNGVIEVPSNKILRHNQDYSEIVLMEQGVNILEEGDIIVIEENNTGFQIARKIEQIQNNSILSLSEVELDEVIDSFIISDVTEVSVDNIIKYYELEEKMSSMSHPVLPTVSDSSNYLPTSVFDVDKKYENKGFKILLSTKEEEKNNVLDISITDNNSGITYTLPIHQEIEKECEYNAQIEIDKIYFATQAIYELGEIQYVDIAMQNHAKVSFGIKKDFEKDIKIGICEIPIPIGGGILGVKLQVSIVIAANGSISFGFEIPEEFSVNYEKNKGFRKLQSISADNLKLQAKLEGEVDYRLEPILFVLDKFDIFDIEADLGISASLECTEQPNMQICTNIRADGLLFTISVCKDDETDSLIGQLGLSAEWQITDAENAEYHFSLHQEHYTDGRVAFVEKCTYDENEEILPMEVEEIITSDELNQNYTYTAKFGEVNAIECPEFCFDYSPDWSITQEKVDNGGSETTFDEIVTISNDRGVQITYMDFKTSSIGGYGRTMNKYIVSKVENAKFAPTIPDGTDTDFSHLGNFVVAKIKLIGTMDMNLDSDYTEIDGSTYYAVLPESSFGIHDSVCGLSGFYEEFSFQYPNSYAFIAEAPDGTFTAEEEQEVIEILASFREK